MELHPDVPQFFIDDTWIGYQHRIVRRWMPAKVFPYPVIEPDRPWESRAIAHYGTVLPDPDGGYRMYYTDFSPEKKDASRTYLLFLARSPDGFRWEKPILGAVEWQGSRDNNIVVAFPWAADSPSVIHDTSDPEAPWKMIVFHTPEREPWWNDRWGLYAYTSTDGISWTMVEGVCLRAGDRTNLMAGKQAGKHVAYTRHVEMAEHTGTRAVYRSESDDFLAWTEPELVMRPDLNDEPDVEYYGMSVFQRHGWFLGLLEYWRADVDVIETHLACSRDGKTWTLPVPRRPFIAATHDWNRTWSTCASNGPLIIGDQMVFYFGGRWTSHHYDSAHQYGTIGYASIPIDRFCAMEATAGGRLITPPFEWPGGELALNADTRQSFTSHPAHTNGSIRIEVQDAEGAPLPGFSGDKAATFSGNTHCRCAVNDGIVHWPGENKPAALRGKGLRLQFDMQHARLFTFQASTVS